MEGYKNMSQYSLQNQSLVEDLRQQSRFIGKDVSFSPMVKERIYSSQ